MSSITRSWGFGLLGAGLSLVAGAAATLGYGASGIYDVGADAPHTPAVASWLGWVRSRSIDAHASGVVAPPGYAGAQALAQGAGLYAEMCSGCHLAPGMAPTELSRGLYPQAPVFAGASAPPIAQTFWTIKHGVKFTAMPAWGRTHPDPLIWDLTAFVEALPGMTPAQYAAAVAHAPADHDEMMHDAEGHAHGG